MKMRFERSGRGQEPSRGHKFSILEKLVRHRDFTSQTLSSFPSDFVGVALVGATPLHLLSQTALPLKSPTGAFIAPLRCAAQTRACLWQAEQAHHANNEKQEVPAGEHPVVHIAIVRGFNRKFYKQSKSQQPVCDMQFTVVANESNRELRWQGASGSRVPIKQYLQKFPKWGRFGVTSVMPFLLLPVHPEGCTPAHRT